MITYPPEMLPRSEDGLVLVCTPEVVRDLYDALDAICNGKGEIMGADWDRGFDALRKARGEQ